VRSGVSQVIDRAVADVFRFCAVDHVRNHPLWNPDLELEQVSEGPIERWPPCPSPGSEDVESAPISQHHHAKPYWRGGWSSRTCLRFATNPAFRLGVMSRMSGSITRIMPEILIWMWRVNLVPPSAGSNR
jgi:hypothetical protein